MRLRDTALAARRIGGKVVVLDHKRSRYLTISGSGTLLFELLQEERTRDDLVAAMLDTYEVDEDTARRDVDEFLTDLSEAGLLST